MFTRDTNNNNNSYNNSKGESCGCRMMSYPHKVSKGQIIQQEQTKDANKLKYLLEIAQTLNKEEGN